MTQDVVKKYEKKNKISLKQPGVYLIVHEGDENISSFIKIGFSSNLFNRLRAYPEGTKIYDIKLIDYDLVYFLEGICSLYLCFIGYKKISNDYFRYNETIRAYKGYFFVMVENEIEKIITRREK